MRNPGAPSGPQASGREKPKGLERAISAKKPREGERAIMSKKPRERERAIDEEKPNQDERAQRPQKGLDTPGGGGTKLAVGPEKGCRPGGRAGAGGGTPGPSEEKSL